MTWQNTFHSELVHGRQIDAYAKLNATHAIAIEVTEEKNVGKIQGDLNKLIHVRGTNFNKNYVQTDCFCVTVYEPTVAMRNVGNTVNISVMSINEFRAIYIPADKYFSKRKTLPFGSAVDPESGEKDEKLYAPVSFLLQASSEADSSVVIDHLKHKRPVILTGEYGTGKSKFLEWIFGRLVDTAWNELNFPLSIDLRSCWGLRDRYEIIRRHLFDLGLPECVEPMNKAYNEGLLTLLIDGFDEMGIQVWTDNFDDLKRLRADALSGVRDLISHNKGGLIVTSRDHYFDSEAEMTSALGLAGKNTIIIRSKAEFSHAELADFLDKNNFNVEIPEWLPRKPLTCELFMRIYDEIPEDKRDQAVDNAQFWNLILDAVCGREARIHPSFDTYTIRAILIEVAAVTRSKLDNFGPISLAEIQRSYEKVVGHTPIDQASVLLQRLPGLGRTSADTQDRRFVDTYLLDGLRAEHLILVLERSVPHEVDHSWNNALGENAIAIASAKLSELSLVETALSFCVKYKAYHNQTLLMDLVSCILATSNLEIDFRGIEITDAYASSLDLSGMRISNLYVADSIIAKLVVVGAHVEDVAFNKCTIDFLEGISSDSGKPDWLRDCKIERFSSVATTSRIRAAKLDPAHKVLVTILRKTFFQKGAGRKEEALTRGLGRLVKPGVTQHVIGKLITEGLLSSTTGNEGPVFVPNRAQTQRAGRIISELTFSKDPIWEYVSTL
ncbi:MAG: hypothetical protein WBW81_06805 [Methylocella sp.]